MVNDDHDPIDQHVATRIRVRRVELGMSEQALAAAIGVSLQQVQKYQSGSNRISAGHIFELSRVLNVPAAYFFEGYGAPDAPETTNEARADEGAMRDALELHRAFLKIRDAELRRRILEMIQAVAQDGDRGHVI